MMLPDLFALGFDKSTQDGRYLSPRCSQCEALVIQGVPCHETGCVNEAEARRNREQDDEDDSCDDWDRIIGRGAWDEPEEDR